jgi:hypothetical protein
VIAHDLKQDAFVILGNRSEFEAICLISEARIILSLGIPNYVRTPIMAWDDDLGVFGKGDYLQTMELFSSRQKRERTTNS